MSKNVKKIIKDFLEIVSAERTMAANGLHVHLFSFRSEGNVHGMSLINWLPGAKHG